MLHFNIYLDPERVIILSNLEKFSMASVHYDVAKSYFSDSLGVNKALIICFSVRAKKVSSVSPVCVVGYNNFFHHDIDQSYFLCRTYKTNSTDV